MKINHLKTRTQLTSETLCIYHGNHTESKATYSININP
jgi:hypothetical protein